jgi:hypothetical protein
VVLGSACDAASCTSRSGTPASRAAVMNVWLLSALAVCSDSVWRLDLPIRVVVFCGGDGGLCGVFLAVL